MKTSLNVLLVLLILTLPAVVQAQFSFTTNNGAITITGYTGAGGNVTIPDTMNALRVTSIGDGAFSFYASLTSVSIPNSVTNIGDNAFENCTSLTSLTIPNGVTSIGESAFDGCAGLTNVLIPSSVSSIGGGAFAGCLRLTSAAIPEGVASIGVAVFEGCTNLASITIPNSVTSIGGGAFAGCSRLTSVAIPNGVASIGNYAFASCNSLTNFIIPNSVSSIGQNAFSSDNNLTSVTIGGSVVSLGSSVFYGCTKLTSVTIPDSVTSIGDFAFYLCWSLTSVTIGTHVTSIGESAFYYCDSLTGVIIPGSVSTIKQGAFQNCSGLRSLTIPNSVTSIGNRAFEFCTSLTSVTIGANVTSIGVNAFECCSSLTNLTIPNSVSSLGDGAFFYCTSLASVRIGTGLTRIAILAFAECYSLTTVIVGTGVGSIAEGAFQDCTNLTGMYFEGNAPSVVPPLFNGDDNVTVYYLPGTAGWTSPFAEGLPPVRWNPQVQPDEASFGVQTNRFGFTISWASGMTVIVEACTNLGNPNWSPLQTNTLNGNSLYFSDPQWTNYPARFYRLGFVWTPAYTYTTNDGGITITGYTGPGGSVIIPGTINGLPVTSIEDSAFAGWYSLTSVTIPSSVTNIGDDAFYLCTNLMGVYFQGNAPTADSTVFADDNNATALYLPGTTGWAAFSANTGLSTALWFLPNPLILSSPNFGAQANGFGFIISWATNIPVVVEACTNLHSPYWSPVSTNTLIDGSSDFSDPDWTNYAGRFYRLRSP